MEYKSLDEINSKLKTIDVKGKNYVEVNTRIKAFWQLCENGKIETEILDLENDRVVIKASIYEDKRDISPRATGIAYEVNGSSFINKTSYIENCETSAIGRALGNAGIGIDTSVASADEVQNAMLNQNKITKTQAEALAKSIRNNNIAQDQVEIILEAYDYKKIEDIMVCDYGKIVKELQNLVGNTKK